MCEAAGIDSVLDAQAGDVGRTIVLDLARAGTLTNEHDVVVLQRLQRFVAHHEWDLVFAKRDLSCHIQARSPTTIGIVERHSCSQCLIGAAAEGRDINDLAVGIHTGVVAGDSHGLSDAPARYCSRASTAR